MKIDQEYLREILNTFIESPRSFIWIEDITNRGLETDDKFLFHIQILEDQHFIECLDKRSDIGYEITLGGNFEWKSRPLRLTASGHEFTEAINRPEIWEILRDEFRDASLSTLKSTATTLLIAFAKKQINKYLEI
ncbi:MAG: DUF2513 domain-containing protein [Gammaproteobacteria bacterium]|nr:DUF2513 domain-containing protein [Gammaproteobacteria bacterium]